MTDLLFVSMVPEINHDWKVQIETLPHLWNGGLALGLASVLLIVLALNNKRQRKKAKAGISGVV